MEKKEINGWLIAAVVIFIILVVVALFQLGESYFNKREGDIVEWDLKYEPICNNLGGLYLEEGYTHHNWCYFNKTGVLQRYCMVKKLNNWYLVDCRI